MPRFIIKLSHQQDQVYEFTKSQIMIGRGEECDLILPNISVSREHAMVKVEEKTSEIADLNSENGITLNNEKINKGVLASNDEVMIGNFSLIYLGDSKDDRFYRNRSITYLPKYDHRRASPTQDATFKLSAREAQALMKEKTLLHNGCVVDGEGNKLFPESSQITFGGKTAQVKISGIFVGTSVVAEIAWDGKRHILEKKSWLVGITANGEAIQKHPLKPGDCFKIGGSSFEYLLDD
jgi:pSer/pThr/pTyr-binding forkhead associated (FHA) protein